MFDIFKSANGFSKLTQLTFYIILGLGICIVGCLVIDLIGFIFESLSDPFSVPYKERGFWECLISILPYIAIIFGLIVGLRYVGVIPAVIVFFMGLGANLEGMVSFLMLSSIAGVQMICPPFNLFWAPLVITLLIVCTQ